MARKTEILAAVVIAALVQNLAGCINQGEGVAPPADKAQRAEGEGTAPPNAKAQSPPDRQDIVPISRSIAGREGWSADAFFTAPNELQICKVISSFGQERLAACPQARLGKLPRARCG